MDGELHSRADVHTDREAPHVAARAPNPLDRVAAKNSFREYTANGSVVDSGATVLLSGSGSMPMVVTRQGTSTSPRADSRRL